ncbi:MAG: hypothetical protein RLY61_843 [Candidatus Parcubacteria bacterium]
MPTRIAIIGGGFGGVYTLLELQKKLKTEEIYIFNKDSDFVFTPLLHEAATGGVSTDNIVVPIRSFINRCNVNFIKDTVTHIDLDSKKINTASHAYDFDYLVLATGSDSNTQSIEGVKEHCLFLKNIDDALAIKRRIISNLERYCLTHEAALLSFTVIGGGPTGVELAFEIDDYISTTLTKYFRNLRIGQELTVNLVCSSDRILSSMPESMQSEAEKRLKLSNINFISKTHVVRITPDAVILDNGKLLNTSTTIWCAGVTPVLPSMVGPVDKLALNHDLTLGDYKNVFALGDCINYGTSVPMDAQAAVKQACFVAQAISNALQGKSQVAAFSYVSSGQLISLGRWHAAGNIKGISVKGALAWWIWRTIYLIRFPSTSKRFKIMLDWTVSIFSERDMSNI